MLWPVYTGFHLLLGNCSYLASILLVVSLVHHINHTLGVGVAIVGGVWWAIVDHGLINWVSGLVRENTSGKA